MWAELLNERAISSSNFWFTHTHHMHGLRWLLCKNRIAVDRSQHGHDLYSFFSHQWAQTLMDTQYTVYALFSSSAAKHWAARKRARNGQRRREREIESGGKMKRAVRSIKNLCSSSRYAHTDREHKYQFFCFHITHPTINAMCNLISHFITRRVG